MCWFVENHIHHSTLGYASRAMRKVQQQTAESQLAYIHKYALVTVSQTYLNNGRLRE